jgi:predicted RNA binding protein YcfA (HicA-like mRNA interferase family)
MPRGVHNWTYRDCVKILRENHFVLHHITGSHHFFVGSVNNSLHQVCIPFHGTTSIKPRTLKSIIAQSGLSNTEWGL